MQGGQGHVALARFEILPGIVPQGKARRQLPRDRTGRDRSKLKGHGLGSYYFRRIEK